MPWFALTPFLYSLYRNRDSLGARLFHGTLQSLLESSEPVALVFKHAQQIVDPKAYLEAVDHLPIVRPGALNVRLFRVDESDDAMVMDTRGLHELGLHDFQCHFRDLEPGAVARVLQNTGVYIFENGRVFESGHTVPGIDPDSRWTCRFEPALVGPDRPVLDLDPGPAHRGRASS